MRLTIDSGAVANGDGGQAQRVLGLSTTLGRHLPPRLKMYAFGARLGGAGVLADAKQLAAQSGIPQVHLLLIDRQSTYAHNDPAGAYPRNAFFAGLMRFLARVPISAVTAFAGKSNDRGDRRRGHLGVWAGAIRSRRPARGGRRRRPSACCRPGTEGRSR